MSGGISCQVKLLTETSYSSVVSIYRSYDYKPGQCRHEKENITAHIMQPKIRLTFPFIINVVDRFIKSGKIWKICQLPLVPILLFVIKHSEKTLDSFWFFFVDNRKNSRLKGRLFKGVKKGGFLHINFSISV